MNDVDDAGGPQKLPLPCDSKWRDRGAHGSAHARSRSAASWYVAFVLDRLAGRARVGTRDVEEGATEQRCGERERGQTADSDLCVRASRRHEILPFETAREILAFRRSKAA